MDSSSVEFPQPPQPNSPKELIGPTLSKDDLPTITGTLALLETIETPKEKALHIFNQLNRQEEPLHIKQKVSLLLNLDPETYEATKTLFEEHQQAAITGMEIGISTQDLTAEEHIRTKSNLRGTPRFIVEADIRIRQLQMWNKYPPEWDDDLIDLDPRFQPDDDLPRIRDGQRLSYEEAVNQRRKSVEFGFIKHIHPLMVNKEIPINPKSLFNAFFKYASNLPQAPENDITPKSIVSSAKSFRSRYRGNQQISDWVDRIIEITNIVLEHQDENGNFNIDAIPETPTYPYPPFDPKRGRQW